jgi:hypothetical protein
MMSYLGVDTLQELSSMIREDEKGQPTSPSWVQAYRELIEWATLFTILRKKDFGTDTLIVYDGLLRSKVFAGDFFKRYIQGIQASIESQKQKHRRKIYLAGIAKHSKVLTRYRLAMALEGILVKFGTGLRDPIWPVDIYLPQASQAHYILGYMLADALNGFPLPLYPQCLQQAHANAALVLLTLRYYRTRSSTVFPRLLQERLQYSTFSVCKSLNYSNQEQYEWSSVWRSSNYFPRIT